MTGAQENTNSRLVEMIKTVQDWKMEFNKEIEILKVLKL